MAGHNKFACNETFTFSCQDELFGDKKFSQIQSLFWLPVVIGIFLCKLWRQMIYETNSISYVYTFVILIPNRVYDLYVTKSTNMGYRKTTSVLASL